jgi:Rrf2 family protein
VSRNCRFAVAVHVAALLADCAGTPVTSDWIASSVNTHPVVVRRTLAALARAGLVRSQRGIAGGSFLARDPGRITLLDLYHATDEQDPQALHHQAPNPRCPVGANIVPLLSDILARAEQAKQTELARTTVADVVAAIHNLAATA